MHWTQTVDLILSLTVTLGIAFNHFNAYSCVAEIAKKNFGGQ